jgi:ATP/maltotriose-dependent transcriptional regulator MalT/two-component SAPR family response regulator
VKASEIPISKTKITLPKRRVELLTRKRLLDSLYEILDRKLIMVSAPAGYGKTSLLIDLAHHSDVPFCWLALDPLDREPQRFITYLIATLTEHFPKFGNRSLSMLNTLTGRDDSMERLLVTLVNEIYEKIGEHFVLVLDDFHLLDGVKSIQYFVNRFVQLVGENCHLIISSRSLTELSDMTLLVAREQVGGLDFSDLSFRPEEIQALLAQNRQIHLSDEDARKLVEATEGWITGLQFTDVETIRSGGNNFHPSHGVGVSVFDYLGQQALENQPEALRTFLLRSSLLEEFDVNLCEAVLAPLYSKPQNWSKLLDTIVQKNLFTLPVGTKGQWLRYHHLFRDYLQERISREHPEEVTPILERLARYNEKNSQWEKAYQLYKRLGNVNATADLIERAGIPMYQHAMLTLETWLKDLPPSVQKKRAGLLSLRGAVESVKGNLPDAIKLSNLAVKKFREEHNTSGLALTLVRRSNTQRLLGNHASAIRDANEAIKLTEAKDDLQWIYADALRIKGLSLYRQGHTLQASRFLERALEIYTREGDSHSTPILLIEIAMTNSAMGKHEEAKASYKKVLEIWRKSGNLTFLSSLLNNLGNLHHQLGEYEQAAHILEEGLLYAQQSEHKRIEALILLSLGDLYSELEDFEIATHYYQDADDLIQQLNESFLINYLALMMTNLALLKNETDSAHQILDKITASVKSSNSNYENGILYLMQGRLALQVKKWKQAVTQLIKARDYFLEDGREMESQWSHVWLAAAYFQNKQKAAAYDEIRKAIKKPNEIQHPTVIAASQALEWLEDLRNEPETRTSLRRLFEKIVRLNNQLPRTRRQLRRLARTMEIPSPKLIIHAFGRGQVWINGKPVTLEKWQTQSVRELFFYFLAENKPLTKEQIANVLWTDIDEPAKIKLRFKNEIYRLRRAVGQDVILFEHEFYQFNPLLDQEYDVEAFDDYLSKARSAMDPLEQITYYQKAVDFVRGKYLESFDATWVIPEQERLSSAFLSASMSLAKLYQKDGQLPKALHICQHATDYDPGFEPAYRQMMEIYFRLKDRGSIAHTYQLCQQNMKRVYDLPPSKETQDLYKKLIS